MRALFGVHVELSVRRIELSTFCLYAGTNGLGFFFENPNFAVRRKVTHAFGNSSLVPVQLSMCPEDNFHTLLFRMVSVCETYTRSEKNQANVPNTKRLLRTYRKIDKECGARRDVDIANQHA